MRTSMLAAGLTLGLFGFVAIVPATVAAQRGGGGPGGAAAQVPKAPTDKTAFWSAEDIQARWKENESLKRATLFAAYKIGAPGGAQGFLGAADLAALRLERGGDLDYRPAGG